MPKMTLPKAVPYVRISTSLQSEGHSIEDQTARMAQYYQDNLKDTHELYETLVDIQSARRFPLFKRDSGRLLRIVRHGGILEPGDMVVIDRVDRCFRSLGDGGTTLDYWKKNGIAVRIRDLGGLDLASTTGEIVVAGMIMAAHVESLIKSQRAKERHEEALKNGSAGGITGYRVKEIAGERRHVIQRDEVRLMEMIVSLRMFDKMSWDKIRIEVERDYCRGRRKKFNEDAIAFHEFQYSRQKMQQAFENYGLFRTRFPNYKSLNETLNKQYHYGDGHE